MASSGTGGWHVGNPMDPRAAATLTTAGYDASRHRARQYDATWPEAYDPVSYTHLTLPTILLV